MCGICGIFNSRNVASIREMSEALRKRGPDDCGTFTDSELGVSLGHRRLAIIDVSQSGHQPMVDPSGRFVIVYNGEIYNFHEIKKELAKAGHQFSSSSDTEVVLFSYLQWGYDCVRRLRGMFAFAILDRGSKYGPFHSTAHRHQDQPSLFLTRDRFGIKPLLYSFQERSFVFASELNSLLAYSGMTRRIDVAALGEYLVTGAIGQPQTILKHVHQLPPGSCMAVTRENRRIWRYYDLVEATRDRRTRYRTTGYRELVEMTQKKLNEATRYHMIADVPVGAFLSGGIDSTSVVALMQSQTSTPIKTFTVGFERPSAAYSELSYAKAAANHLGCDHSELIVTGADVRRHFDSIVDSIDQPSIDGTNTYFASYAAAQHIKVSISGLGGDELFGGYPHFRYVLRNAGLPFSSAMTRMSSFAFDMWPNRYTRELVLSFGSFENRLRHLRLLTSKRRLRHMITDRVQSGLNLEVVEHPPNGLACPELTPLGQVSRFEIERYLLNTLLRDGDVMSMTHSLEVRPVLLDHPLVEHIFSVPDRFKFQPQRPKQLLVDAVKDMVPEFVLARKKMGFELPFSAWLNGPLKDMAIEILQSKTSKQIFRPGFIERQIRRIGSRTARRETWSYLVLVQWIRKNRCSL